jgi:hypothetical protein
VPLGDVTGTASGGHVWNEELADVSIRLLCLAVRRRAVYDRFSMIAATANVKALPAAIAAFAIIAPSAR